MTKERLLIFDGAFGTYYAEKYKTAEPPELATVENPDAVLEIHREYIKAGANAIKTDTFSANRGSFENPATVDAIIKSACALAIQAADGAKDGVTVFADIGPVTGDGADEEYIRLCRLFLENGVNNFLFETQCEMTSLCAALDFLNALPGEHITAVSFASGQDGFTRTGEYYRTLMSRAWDAGADYVGLNCTCGPAHIFRLLSAVSGDGCRLIAMPNSGYPSAVGDRTLYVDNPEYFASRLADIVKLGVSAVGGCCGTTPAHIGRFCGMLASRSLTLVPPVSVSGEHRTAHGHDFEKKFIAVELPAPADTDMSYLISAATVAKAAGADFVTIPDSPLGRTRASSIMTAALVQRETGICTIPHLCCRDRNQIAIRGDLVSGNIAGISRILAITGDTTPGTGRESPKGVFGFNSFQLISFIKSLNPLIFQHNPYSVAAALNLSAENFESELERAKRKIDSGADCLFTQPVFSDEQLANLQLALKRLPCRIAAGILPLAGYKNACFLNNEVPGITLPDELLDSLNDKERNEADIICFEYAKSIIDRIGFDIGGFYIMVQLKRIDTAERVIKHIKERFE